MKFIRVIIYLYVFILSINSFSALRSDTFSYKTFFKKDGLPNNHIYCTLETSDGFIWIGSQGGLTRYDGSNFLTFDIKNTPEISVNDVVQLCEIEKGKLFVATLKEGLIYSQGKFKKITLIDSHVNFIKKDIANNIVIGAYEKLLLYKDNKIKDLTDILDGNKLLYGFYSSNLLTDIFLCTNNGLLILDKDYNVTQIIEKSIYFYKIVYWNNSLIACSDNGFYQILKNQKKWVVKKIDELPNDQVFKLVVGKDGKLYGMADRKIVAISVSSITKLKVEIVKIPKEIKLKFRDMKIDSHGNFWISTGGGLFCLTEGTFKSSSVFKDSYVNSFFKSKFDNVLVGTNGKGVFHYFKNELIGSYLKNESIFNVFIDSHERFWVSTKKQLCVIEKRKLKEIFEHKGKSFYRIFTVFEDEKGKIWIINNESISYYLNGKLFTLDFHLRLKDSIRTIVEDKNNGLFLAGGDGLFYFKGNKLIEIKNNEKSLPFVFNLYLDQENTLFIGTDEGFYRYKNNIFKKITFKDGLNSNWISSIVEDNLGKLWLGTDGVQVANKSALNDYFDGKVSKLDFENYGVEDGLPSIELSAGYGNSAFKDNDGCIWYCTMKGLAKVNPSDIIKDRTFSKPIIDSVYVENVKVDKYKPIVVKPSEKRIEFDYTAPKFYKNDLLEFKVNLEGYEDVWKITKDRKISYTNLNPGDYVLKIKSNNSMREWGKETTSLTFRIIRPYYMTWWFYSICVIFAFIFLTLLFKLIRYLIQSAIFMNKSQFVGPYKIVETIGTGGMGIVYKAVSLESKKVVALKVLNELITDDELKKRFIMEGIICEKIEHQNIVKIYDRGEHRNRLYYAMEYCNGVTLRSVLNREKLPLLKCLWVISVLIDVLYDIHSKGIVHRDVKPENIMLTKNFDLHTSKMDNRLLPNLKNSLKLLDFGLAKAIGNTALTKTGLLAGTVYYLPPETIHTKIDWYPVADFYSTGVLFYEMLTGLRPFEGDDMMEVMYKILEITPESPKCVDKSIPQEVSDFADSLLVKEPDCRLTEYKEIRRQLDELIKKVVDTLSLRNNEK